MKPFKFGNRSYSKLIGVNPILAYIAVKTIERSPYDFTLFEGVRTLNRQRLLVSSGRSWTMNSRHLTGNAVDLVPLINGRITWDGPEAKRVFNTIYTIMNEEATKIGVTLRCGADWKSVDLPHFELTKEFDNGYDYRRYTTK